MNGTLDPTLRQLLRQPLSIERREVREDSAGGQAVRWVKIAELLGRISFPPSSRPADVNIALSGYNAAPYYVYLPTDSGIQRGDIINDGRRRLRVDSVQWPSVEAFHRAECYEAQEEIPHRAPEQPEEP